jgi:hypothetical protein
LATHRLDQKITRSKPEEPLNNIQGTRVLSRSFEEHLRSTKTRLSNRLIYTISKSPLTASSNFLKSLSKETIATPELAACAAKIAV